MKLISLTVPMLIVSLIVIAVWGVGMLTVRASAVSTQTSIDLLRMHLRVERLHEQLLRHSREALAAHVESILEDGGETPEAEAGQARPWPAETAGADGEVAAALAPVAPLESGLRQAQPALRRLLGRLQQTLPIQ